MFYFLFVSSSLDVAKSEVTDPFFAVKARASKKTRAVQKKKKPKKSKKSKKSKKRSKKKEVSKKREKKNTKKRTLKRKSLSKTKGKKAKKVFYVRNRRRGILPIIRSGPSNAYTNQNLHYIINQPIENLRVDGIAIPINHHLKPVRGTSADRVFSTVEQINTGGRKALQAQCNEFVRKQKRKRLGTGDTFITKGYGLPAEYIMYAVPPKWSLTVGKEGAKKPDYPRIKKAIRRIYQEILEKAKQKRMRSIAMLPLYSATERNGMFIVPSQLDEYRVSRIKEEIFREFTRRNPEIHIYEILGI